MRNWISTLTVLVFAMGLATFAVAQEGSDEEQAVKMTASKWAEAWNAGDMKAVGELYAEGSDYVNFFGQAVSGRDEIEASFTEVRETVYKGGKISIEPAAVHFVKPDVAVFDSVWEIKGLPEAEGAPPSKGDSSVVVVKQDGEWKIVAHRTRIPSPPSAGQEE